MKKFTEYLKEDLGGALVEPQSQSSADAKKLGLVYAGFGRYEDPKTNQITHVVQNDRLVPFSRAIRTNTFQQQSGDDYGNYVKNMKPDIDQVSQLLVNSYKPENYSPEELDAIQAFTDTAYYNINQRLISLPTGIGANAIQPVSIDDFVPKMIADIDSAIAKSKAPVDFMAYTGLGSAYDFTQFMPGQVMSFKGYRSTTLNPNIALNNNGRNGQQDNPQTVVLQIQIPKGSSGLYVSDFSAKPDEAEYILPRASAVQIVNGPTKITGSNAFTQESNLQVIYFNCVLVK